MMHGTQLHGLAGKNLTATRLLYNSEHKHLSGLEIQRLIEAIQSSRNEARDHYLLLLMLHRGLRVSEACRLKLDQVDTDSRVFPELPPIRQLNPNNSVYQSQFFGRLADYRF